VLQVVAGVIATPAGIALRRGLGRAVPGGDKAVALGDEIDATPCLRDLQDRI
jgi:hypothetical protein